MTGVTYGVMAGYDGSPCRAEAVRWAAREAERRGTTLTVCLAWAPDHMTLPTESVITDLARQHGMDILAHGLPRSMKHQARSWSARTDHRRRRPRSCSPSRRR